MEQIEAGDVLIRRSLGTETFELRDAVTGDLLAAGQTLRAAMDLAIARGGALWQQNADHRGRILGNPVTLMPRSPGNAAD